MARITKSELPTGIPARKKVHFLQVYRGSAVIFIGVRFKEIQKYIKDTRQKTLGSRLNIMLSQNGDGEKYSITSLLSSNASRPNDLATRVATQEMKRIHIPAIQNIRLSHKYAPNPQQCGYSSKVIHYLRAK